MKSPFPGMDPYIEACGLWDDFHSHLIEKIVELADLAPEHYLVRTGGRSYVVPLGSEGKESYPFLPDVSMTAPRNRKKCPRKGGTAFAEPAGDAGPVIMRAIHPGGASRSLHRNLRGDFRPAPRDNHRGSVTFEQASRHRRMGTLPA